MMMENMEKATQGKVVGVIIPPPEIRAIIDKTSIYVAKGGRTFEQRVLESKEGKTAKFNFMREGDPYRAYYEMKIR
jgi:splicing factor 3A subunit 1